VLEDLREDYKLAYFHIGSNSLHREYEPITWKLFPGRNWEGLMNYKRLGSFVFSF
jgi:hypothetical protein